MKKLSLVLLMSLFCFALLSGASVSVGEAEDVGYKWLRHIYPDKAVSHFEKILTVEKNGQAMYHILTAQGGGFVLVAANDVSEPILGYSDTGSFEYPVTSPEVLYWLGTYEDQLREAQARNISNTAKRPLWDDILAERYTRWDGTRAVLPLLQTTWNQDTYYNQSCPVDAAGPNGHAYAGCSATAMGQVMKKWGHPAQGTISHSYVENNYGTLSANFGATTYNWAAMPNNLTTYNTAVATLLYHCGVGVDMDYGPTASSANAMTNDAMEVFFGYDPAAQWQWRSSYTDAVWISMMQNDLNLGRPVIYQGYNSSYTSGHSFVMDGYNASNYFHINWGWGGQYNGYFLLNSLIPVTGWDFSYFQWAYFNLFPGVTISGTVTNTSAQPLAGVSISLSGAGTATTDANGVYSIAVSSGYSGTATPSLAGYTFTPSSRSYTNITSNQTAQNYSGGASPPNAPSNLIAMPASYTQINLFWTDNSNNESGFLIDYMLAGNPTWYYLATVGADNTYYAHMGLLPGTGLTYRVLAYNSAGNSAYAYSTQVFTPSPPPPANLATTGIQQNGAVLSWNEMGTAAMWDVEWGPPGFILGTGTYFPGLPTPSFFLGGLSPNTPYDWYVRSDYGLYFSPWSGPVQFTTLSAGLPYPWSENLEAGFVNLVSDPASNTLWTLDTNLFSQGLQSTRNIYQASNTNILVTSASFSLTGATWPILYFDQIAKVENNYDHAYVEISTDNGATWTIFPPHEYLGTGNYVVPTQNTPEGPCFMSSSYPQWSSTTPDNTWWRAEKFDLRAYQGSSTVMIRFRLKSDTSVQQYGWLIDNVRVQDLPLYDFSVAYPAGVSVGAGLSYDYPVTLTNTGQMPDSYTPSFAMTGAWTYGFYMPDGVTPLAVPFPVPPGASFGFVVKVTTPVSGPPNFATDTEGVNFISASGQTFTFPLTTMLLYGDTTADAIVINSLPFSQSSSTVNYNHNYGPYGDISGLVNLVNPITGYYSATGTLGSSPDVVYKLVLATPTLLSIDLLGSAYDTVVALVTAPGTGATDVILLNDDYYTAPVNAVSYVNSGCSYVPAGTYYIIVGAYGTNKGNYTLSVAAATPPVTPTVAISLNAGGQTVLSWTQNTAMRYNIYSDTDPFGSFSTVEATNVNAGTYTVPTIPAVNTYYRVTEKFCFTYPSKGDLGEPDKFPPPKR